MVDLKVVVSVILRLAAGVWWRGRCATEILKPYHWLLGMRTYTVSTIYSAHLTLCRLEWKTNIKWIMYAAASQ